MFYVIYEWFARFLDEFNHVFPENKHEKLLLFLLIHKVINTIFDWIFTWINLLKYWVSGWAYDFFVGND